VSNDTSSRSAAMPAGAGKSGAAAARSSPTWLSKSTTLPAIRDQDGGGHDDSNNSISKLSMRSAASVPGSASGRALGSTSFRDSAGNLHAISSASYMRGVMHTRAATRVRVFHGASLEHAARSWALVAAPAAGVQGCSCTLRPVTSTRAPLACAHEWSALPATAPAPAAAAAGVQYQQMSTRYHSRRQLQERDHVSPALVPGGGATGSWRAGPRVVGTWQRRVE
jgi:hypothetical protein